MSMSFIQRIITIIIVIIGTIITRFLPFLIFPESSTPPRYVQYLGKVLPFAVIGMLVIYSLKNVSFHSSGHGLPEIIAISCIIFLYRWKRNMLVCMIAGTILYMLLVQFVFIS